MSGGGISDDDGLLDLVGSIYEAALDAQLWPETLNRIGDAVGGPEVMFGVFDPATGLSNMLAPRTDPERLRSLLEWAPRNPLLPLGTGLAPGTVFTCGDFMSEDEFTSTAFYQEWWRPSGFDNEPLTTNLLVDGAASGILTSYGRLNRAPFDGVQKRRFAVLAQHLVRAVALQRRLHHLAILNDGALAGLDELPQGFLLVDADSRPLFVNRAARALLDSRDGLRLDANTVSACDAGIAQTLRELIASCATGALTVGGNVTVTRNSGRLALEVLVTPIARETAIAALPSAISQRAAAVLLVTDRGAENQGHLEDLRERFGLTSAEAGFALEIAKGDGRQAAADRLGITVGTARSHLSNIFDKTGVRRQAELVRLLLRK
jgi:DNA-binding CsgD family transcriptional regulator